MLDISIIETDTTFKISQKSDLFDQTTFAMYLLGDAAKEMGRSPEDVKAFVNAGIGHFMDEKQDDRTKHLVDLLKANRAADAIKNRLDSMTDQEKTELVEALAPAIKAVVEKLGFAKGDRDAQEAEGAEEMPKADETARTEA